MDAATTDSDSNKDDENDEEIEVVAETGKNPLSDFPHPRYDCVLKLFSKDPVTFCSNCYCYVCDVKASECKKWSLSGEHEEDSHCFAESQVMKWKRRRSRLRSRRRRPERELKNIAIFLQDTVPTKLPLKRRKREIMRYGHSTSRVPSLPSSSSPSSDVWRTKSNGKTTRSQRKRRKR
mmetsp:Transcript_9063/g.22173  ORF Transcript_9063/g.22173 Transcript_9063/m.22173 type:complete len:178 (-) Transcript_9063:272-805(-)